MIENMQEIIDYMTTNKDSAEVSNYVGGLSKITSDRANEFLSTEDGKKFLQPKLDGNFNKGLETWKANNLNALVDARVKELHPDADPRDIKLNEMKKMMESMQSENTHKDLTNKALQYASDKKLPSELVSYFIGADQATTDSNLEKFLSTMSKHDEAIKLEFAKGGSYTPPAGKKDLDANKAMKDEISQYFK